MSGLEWLPLALSGAGAAVSAIGTIASGQAEKDAAYFRAAQEEQAAQESRAASQRKAIERRREGAYATSRLQALSAASGGGADDPGVIKLGEDIGARSELQALTEDYRGENAARGYMDRAAGSRMTGDAAQTASYFKAASTIISSGSSMYDRYKSPGRGGYG